MATEDPGDFVDVGYYVVAFFDLLGQQSRLRNLRALPDSKNLKEMEEVRQTLRNTYGAVMQMREWFSDAFDAYASPRARMDLSELTESQREEFSSLTNRPIGFYGFSDSMVAHLAMRSDESARLPVRGIFGILSAAATTFTCSLAAGHPLRGGIDIGIGFEHGPNEIYGPVLSRAYALESEVANYPRIVVGEELVRYLNLQLTQAPDSALAKTAIATARHCIDCLATDMDGVTFIDYMGPKFFELVGNKIDKRIMRMAYEQVCTLAAEFKASKNSKLAFRFALLQDYIEDRLPIWAE